VFDDIVKQTKQGHGMLRLYVQPRSSRNEICGIHGDSLKVAITAPPLEGRANKAVILLCAKLFSVHKKDVTLLTGEHSRFKTIVFSSLTAGDIKQRLLPHLQVM